MNIADCAICPRQCHRDRTKMEKGNCLVTGENVLLARAALHFWEEPCISGSAGSGTVFFSGCNLHCVYCQNREISGARIGREISVARLAEIFLELQEKGARNINLVTPTHYACQIREAIPEARKKGLRLPIVYNTSGYESVETLREMEPVIDIYLTDFKYLDESLARSLSGAADYPEVAKKALSEMARQKPVALYDADGYMKSGILVRHLLLPGHVKNGEAVLDYLYKTYENTIVYSLMNQYTPIGEIPDFPELSRPVTKREYERFLDYALDLGITNAYTQEGKTQSESFVPAFDYEGVEHA